MPGDVLIIDKISKNFGNLKAVDSLSANLPAGCIYGFLGPNGAGKTTTIRMIMDIIHPDSGQVRVLGESSIDRVRDRIGYMPEERGLYRKMKVRDVIAYIGTLHGMSKAELDREIPRWLDELELSDWGNNKVEELSRGMQQKLQFIVTVINGPELLILDEPFAGLDPLNLDRLKSIMLKLRDAGKTVIREYAETVKTKAFLIGILLTPVLMAGIILLPKFLTEKAFSEAQPPKHLAVLNLEEALAVDLDSAFASHNQSRPGRQIIPEFHSVFTGELDSQTQELKQEILDGNIDALLVIEQGVILGEGSAVFYTKKITDFEFHPAVQRLVNNAVTSVRCRQNELSRELVDRIRRWVAVEEVNLGVKTEKKRDKMIFMMIPFVFMFMLFMGVITASQGLLNSIIEEKSSRVIEVLLAAVTPFQLMAGKIFGQSAVGFTLVAAYGAAAYIAAVYKGFVGIITPALTLYFIVYFILGFLIFASIFAAIGSVCNSIKETQNMMMPIMMVLVLPMMSWFYIAQRPDAAFAVALSFIPLLTPMVMILRIAVNPDLPLFQIIASILLLAASVPVVIWAAAKIFRTGLLMYGKPPSLREIVRWVRYG